jgi:hypothetical protein
MTDDSLWEVGTFPIRGTNRWHMGGQAQLRDQAWDSLDRLHAPPADVFYTVAEASQHSLGGLPVEAGNVNTGNVARTVQWAKISLAEEQSLDTKTDHLLKDVGLFRPE